MSLNNYIIASNPKINVWVCASAGSGKTKSLTDRFLKLLLDDVEPEKILCLTFTKVAATEMLNRIRSTLGKWSELKNEELRKELEILTGTSTSEKVCNIAKSLFQVFISRQDKLQIQTIHSFCQKILIRFPLEAGIRMNPVIINDQQRFLFIEKSKSQFLNQYKDELEDTKFLDYLLENIHESTLDALIEKVIFINSVSDFINTKKEYENKIYETLNFDPSSCKEIKDKLLNHLKTTVNKNKSILSSAYTSVDINAISESLKFIKSDYSTSNIESMKDSFLTKDGSPKVNLINKKLSASNPSLLLALNNIQSIVQEYNDLEISEKTFNLSKGFIDLVFLFSKHFAEIKNQSGCIDYNDLINATLTLLRNESLKDWIESKLDQKISHIMVDESQDVNLRQWQIIHTCLKDFFSGKEEKPNTIFVVGDPKQSIYSFQGSSPELFSGMKKFVENTAESFGNKINEVTFANSFRSDALVLNFIDHVFASISKINENYFCENNLQHTASKKFSNSSVEVWPLVMKQKNISIDKNSYEWKITDNYENNYNPPRVLAKMIARKIYSAIEEDSFAPSDFMILVRKRDDLSSYIVQELKDLNIPVSGIDRLILNDNIAIKDLIALIQFILLPEDDYNLACVLKSPIFSVSEEQLLQISQRGEKTIWENICSLSGQYDYLKEIKTILEDLINNKEIHSPYLLVTHILETKKYRNKFLSRLGMHTNEILDEFIEICLEFEQSMEKSLLSFLHWFNSSRIEIKKEISTESQEVKVMTIHGAKGLQARFVILPDTASIPKNKDSIIFDQINDIILYNVPENKNTKYQQIIKNLKLNTIQEYYRLLYVGLTRSSEHLLICGHSSSSAPELSWYNVINETLSNIGKKTNFTNLFGFKNVKEIEEGKDCFISSSDYILKIEQGHSSKKKHVTQNKKISALPDFLSEPYVDNNECYTSSPSEKLLHKTQDIEYAVNIGKLTHRILEYFVPLKRKITTNEVKKFIEIYKETNSPKFTTNQLDKICHLANNYLLPLTRDSKLETELKIKKSYRDNEKEYIVSGIIDLLIFKGKYIKIIDYKTDKNIPKTSSEVDLKYLKQMAAYKKMVENIYPDHIVTCHLAWTHDPTIIKIDDAIMNSKDLELT